MEKQKIEATDRKIPVSITLSLKHLIILENKTGSGNYSKYIRELIEKDNVEDFLK